MKIALLGTAPSSMHLVPFGDPAWKIFACSPGTYPMLTRCDAFFELHRWEPGEIGKAATQKPWFTPEYVQWLAMRPMTCPVWMYEAVPQIPASRTLPVNDLLAKYGSYFFTSSIAWMLACAIEDILESRETRKALETARGVNFTADQDEIALYGIDMAANEEYGYQRAGCQYFVTLANTLGIKVYVPPESDLLRPMPLYGIDESSWWMIKLTARQRELSGRLNQAKMQMEQAARDVAFLTGALDDMDYHLKTWGGDRDGIGISNEILAKSPTLMDLVAKEAVLDQQITASAPVDLGALRQLKSVTKPLQALDAKSWYPAGNGRQRKSGPAVKAKAK